MKKLQPDFEYISYLLEDFFARRTLKSALRVIAEHEITGWEVWFQVEFARFLAEHESAPEWQRECLLEFDYRMEKTRSYLRPDFIIRKKRWALDRYVALEIKQHHQIGNCISNMISDLAKVAKIRKTQLDVRSLWALGLFPTDPDRNVHELIKEKLEDWGLEYYESRVKTSTIPGTAYSYALF